MKNQILPKLSLLFSIVFCCFSSLDAQWQFLGSPESCHAISLDAEGDTIVVITSAGLFFSIDNASSWDAIDTPDSIYLFREIQIEDGALYLTISDPEAVQGSSIWKSEVYRSDDWGSTWHLTTGPMDPTHGLNTLIIVGDTVYYLNYGRATVSFDRGVTYNIEIPGADVNRDYFIHNHRLHAISPLTLGNGLIWSDDFGIHWDTIYSCSAEYQINRISSISNVLWKTENGPNDTSIFISNSTDHGITWTTTANVNVPFIHGARIMGDSGHLFLVNDLSQSDVFYFSSDNGHTWIEKSSDLQGWNPVYTNNTLLMASYQGILVSHDDGDTFAKSANGLKGGTVINFAHAGSTIWANANFAMHTSSSGNPPWIESMNIKDVESTTDGHLIAGIDGKPYVSNDGGNSWTVIPPEAFGMTFYYEITAVEAAGNVMYLYTTGDVFASTDFGVTWDYITELWFSGEDIGITYNDGKYITATWDGFVKMSDDGIHWYELAAEFPFHLWGTQMVHYHDPYIFISSDTLLLRLHKDSSAWELIPSPVLGNSYPLFPIYSSYTMQSHGNVLIVAYYGHGVFASLDNGEHWYAINNGLDNFQTTTLSIINTDLYLGVDGGVWRRPLSELAPFHYSGTTYSDSNLNGLKDAGEIGLPDIFVRKRNQNNLSYSQPDGSYLLYSDNTEADTIEALPPRHGIITSNPVPVTATQDSIHFGVYYTPGIYDAVVVLTNEIPLRPGFETKFVITYKNHGTEVANMEIKFALAEELEYISSTLPPFFNGDTLMWMIQDVQPGSSGRIVVRTMLHESTAIGSVIYLAAIIPVIENDDYNVTDNMDTLSLTVVGSYDPNDKSVFPSGYITPAMIADTQRLEYTIRFQNTGNYPASFVRIQDTLSSHLDLTTLEILSASHSYTWQLLPHNVLDVYFENINLPDSTADERSSHGFVKFAINAKTNLQLADNIENKAYIYFDFNQPVVTNTVGNNVGFGTGIKDPSKRLSLSASPVPTKDFVTISIDNTDVSGDVVLTLYDAKGVFVKSQTSVNTDNIRVDMRDLSAGIYLLQTRMGDKNGTISIMKN